MSEIKEFQFSDFSRIFSRNLPNHVGHDIETVKKFWYFHQPWPPGTQNGYVFLVSRSVKVSESKIRYPFLTVSVSWLMEKDRFRWNISWKFKNLNTNKINFRYRPLTANVTSSIHRPEKLFRSRCFLIEKKRYLLVYHDISEQK